ncbi:MAG TPA: molybdate ABC transporter substrate-binding protein [Candidatus Limnocylindrales bacterium]|nr:molybdate ABC transporter substrate-binding protein [Candidatus Limnocylindrales bacterium]
MNARAFAVRAAVAAVVVATAVACQPRFGATLAEPSAGTLTIYAAASLKAPLDAVASAYRRSFPDVRFTVSTDSSAALAAKIHEGAPADVFLSADTESPAKLAATGLVDAPVVFAGNAPAIVVPAADPAAIATPADLARPGLKIVAAADGVPITAYARELVAALASEPGYPADFEARYEANVVSREDNVGATLAKVALGEADAAIVYVTDARATANVRTITLPDDVSVRATYAGAVVLSSPNRGPAAHFLGWLAGPDGQAILGPLGFLPPP